MGSARGRYLGFAMGVLAVGAVALFSIAGAASTVAPQVVDHLASPLEEKAERVERQLQRQPRSKKLLLAAFSAWAAAGNDRLSQRQTVAVPSAVAEDLRASVHAWNRYLRLTGGKADPGVAEAAAGIFFQLVEIGSVNLKEIESNTAGAARAGRIAGAQRPTLYTLSNVATYEYFNGDFAAGDRAAAGAEADLEDKALAGLVEKQLDEYRERGVRFRRRLERAAQVQRESGERRLRASVKGFGSPAGINGTE